MTAAKVMDIISRLPGCAGQAADDAVSAYTQVKMDDAPHHTTPHHTTPHHTTPHHTTPPARTNLFFGRWRGSPGWGNMTSANFEFSQFLDVEFMDHKGWGPKGWERKGWALKGGVPKILLFFPYPATSFHSFLLGGVLKVGALQCARLFSRILV